MAKPSAKQQSIYSEITAERQYQDQQWGGPDHDDDHSIHDWIAFITVYGARAVESSQWGLVPQLSRSSFIKIAALAVAAIESLDRSSGR